MTEKDTPEEPSSKQQFETITEEKSAVENLIEDFKIRGVSSDEMIKAEISTAQTLSPGENDEGIDSANRVLPKRLTENEPEDLEEKSPVFRELAEPKLPALPVENRARLQMQSPNKLYFYWSIKNNPFQTLSRVFGGRAENYTLVAKLVNRTQNSEELVPIETDGSTWFDVDAASSYRAEIGFYAANRPFVRVMFSNTVATPRKNPSPRRDFSSDWTVSANQFAKVLDVSGYAQDAAEVALAGDDFEVSQKATRNAFSQIVGYQAADFVENNQSEIRFVLLALASGYALEALRGQISKNLFTKLQENSEKLNAAAALAALQENFGDFAEETVEEFGNTVFGASSINFPHVSRRRVLPKFAPLSSLR